MLIRFLMLAVHAPGAAAPPPPPPAVEAPPARAAVLDMLRRSPLGPILAALERNFPEEAAAMTGRLRREAVATGDIEAIAGVVPRALVTILSSKKKDILNAPAESLLRVNRVQVDLYRAALAADADYCARSIPGWRRCSAIPVRCAALPRRTSAEPGFSATRRFRGSIRRSGRRWRPPCWPGIGSPPPLPDRVG